MKTCRLLLICLLLCTACTNSQVNPLCRAWIYDDDFTDEQTAENETLGSSIDYSLNPSHFINLRTDGSYTACFKNFEEGRWQLKDKNLLLINNSRQLRELKLYRQKENELVLMDKMKRNIYRFKGFNNQFAATDADPFAAAANQWRRKASRKESDRELCARLKNHFRYWQNYFRWGVDQKIDYLDVRSTPTMVKLYGNGFELYYQQDLAPEWKEVFYDSTDCRIAYEMLYYKMYEKDVQWDKNKTRFESLASAFEQLQGWMDEPVSKYVRH